MDAMAPLYHVSQPHYRLWWLLFFSPLSLLSVPMVKNVKKRVRVRVQRVERMLYLQNAVL